MKLISNILLGINFTQLNILFGCCYSYAKKYTVKRPYIFSSILMKTARDMVIYCDQAWLLLSYSIVITIFTVCESRKHKRTHIQCLYSNNNNNNIEALKAQQNWSIFNAYSFNLQSEIRRRSRFSWILNTDETCCVLGLNYSKYISVANHSSARSVKEFVFLSKWWVTFSSRISYFFYPYCKFCEMWMQAIIYLHAWNNTQWQRTNQRCSINWTVFKFQVNWIQSSQLININGTEKKADLTILERTHPFHILEMFFKRKKNVAK